MHGITPLLTRILQSQRLNIKIHVNSCRIPNGKMYGLTTTSHSGAVVVSAKIEINTSTIGSSTAFRRSTVTHEFAHLMWLNDNPSTTDFSLMRHNRDREIIYTPQMIDIYHLLKKY